MYITDYGIGVEINQQFDDVISQTEEALKEQGFGVLSDIDVKATLKTKLDVDFRRYRILGACNPPLAHRALTEEIEIGLLLPCNVIVYETDNNTCKVVAVNPVKMFSVMGNAAFEELAEEVRSKLTSALYKLESPVVVE